MKDDRTTFHVWCNGDPSVGIDGDQAIVNVYVPPNDYDYLRCVKECLKDCFQKIWDDTSTHVLTEDECKAEDEAEEKFDLDSEVLDCIIDDEDAISALKSEGESK